MSWLAAATVGFSLLGGLFGSKKEKSNEALQREFAQSGFQWRAVDAKVVFKQSGLHPLAIMSNGSGAQYTPI